MVNGKAITLDDVTFFLNARQDANPMDPTSPELVLNELINRELLVAEARKAGIDKRPDIQRMIDVQRDSLLANELLAAKMEEVDTSDEALKAEYDAQVSELELTEYKARHILLKTEEEANAIIEELAKGADFATLAKEKSTGPSGPDGGDLGWFQSDSMVAEFADAVKALKKGEVSKAPVKTQFGWHVVTLEDTRDREAPPFDGVKEQLKGIVGNKAVEKYLSEIREGGDIQFMDNQTAPSADAPANADQPAPTQN
ncbi:unnamed protein product [Cyprideis torosa]|uniref:Peptidyl-prolyl cis-trans isomerase n=1 Tax=Cyprideis torosa TaxID=163714 RepID=A0A7R8X2Y9_9CRUS|nr:unnamed protein product [Cyprideis torosa]CAG0911090.1 unnamed protein product [Cyprideis torosa]